MRHRGIEISATSLLAAAALALICGAAGAQVSSEKAAAAEALFQEARGLSAKKDYAAACPKFKASYELDPGYGVLFNLAECYANLGKTASAWVAYTDAANIARSAGQKDRIEKAEKRAAELAPKLEKLVVQVSDPPAGLVVKRDGLALDGATWGAALPVDPGKHTVSAEAPDRKPWSGEVETKGPGSTVTVSVPALEAAPAPAGTEAAPTATSGPTGGPPVVAVDEGRATRRTIGLVVGGAGVAALVVGAAMGGLASSKWNDARDNHCRTETLCDDAGVALVGDAKTFATVSTAMFIGGGVLAAGGAALFVLSLGNGKKEGAGLQVVPSAGPKTGALLIKGRF
jgi:hypothetical protein